MSLPYLTIAIARHRLFQGLQVGECGLLAERLTFNRRQAVAAGLRPGR